MFTPCLEKVLYLGKPQDRTFRYSVQCFTPRTGLPIGSSPLRNPIHYVFKVLVARSAYYRWARSLYSAHLLMISRILGDLLRIKADCCRVGADGFPVIAAHGNVHATDPSRRFLTHPTSSWSGGQSWSGVGFVTALLSPITAKRSTVLAVPRS
jgi:hypothetical protein